MSRADHRPVLLAVASLVAVRAVALAVVATDRCRSFASLWPIDLANVNQAIWNTAHGRPYFCTLFYQGPRDHFDPMLMALSPVYLFTDNIFWVFLAYAALVGSGALAVHRLARGALAGPTLPLLFALYFLAFSPLLELNVLEIRGDVLAVPFLLLAWVAYAERRFPTFAAALGLAMTCKESVALVVALWGVLALLERRPARWVVTPIVAGAAVLLFTLFVYHPYIQGHAYKHTLLEHPPADLGLGHLVAPDSWSFLIRRFFAASGLLGLLSPAALLPSAPLTLAPFVWREMLQRELWLHCLAPAYPFLFAAMIRATATLQARLPSSRRGTALLAAFLAVSTGAMVVDSWLRLRPPPPDADDRAAWELIAMIPPRASVSAPPLALAALSTRPRLHSLGVKDHRARDIDPLAVDFVLLEPGRLRWSKLVREGQRRQLEAQYFAMVERVRAGPDFVPVARRGSWELHRRVAPAEAGSGR